MLNHIKKYIKSIFTPLPSFFDLCVGGFLYIPWIKGQYNKAIFFVFYSAFLILLSLSLKSKREYKSLPLSLLAIWSLLNVFIHAYIICTTSQTMHYLNLYLMVEGFLYIFFAVLFLKVVISYSTNIRYIYFLLPIAIYPWYAQMSYRGSVTPIAGLGVAIVVYLFLSKRFKLGILSALIGLIGVVLHWSWIVGKFFCRPIVWRQLCINLFYRPVRYSGDAFIEIIDPGIQFSPWLEKIVDAHIPANIVPWLAGIFGSGFQQILNSKYTWVDKDLYGWLYRQSDYLALGDDLGPITIILVVWFIISSFRTIGIHPALILFLMVVLVCGFQMTMYIPDRAGIYLMIMAVIITSGIKRRTI